MLRRCEVNDETCTACGGRGMVQCHLDLYCEEDEECDGCGGTGRAGRGDLIDAWHAGASPLPLHEYLGMSWDEYAQWLERRL